MNEKTLRALVDAGAIKRIEIVADGTRFYVKASTQTGSLTASTQKGTVKTWVTLDAAAKWVRSLGLGSAYIDVQNWQPQQRQLSL